MQPTRFALQRILLMAGIAACAPRMASAQPPQGPAQLAEARKALEDEMESVAIVERKVMVPMRDGKRMAADIAQGDGAYARRQAHGRRHLPSEGHFEEVSGHLCAHAVQLQLLGCEKRRAGRYEDAFGGRQARLRIRRDE